MRGSIVSLTLALAGCVVHSTGPAPQSSQQPQQTGASNPVLVAPQNTNARPYPTSTSTAQPAGGSAVSLSPGFLPDPMVARGSAGGSIAASSLARDCVGWVSGPPTVEATMTGTFPFLRVIADGGNTDLTLVVQRPDGSFACNDDADGTNPVVDGPMGIGVARIWVGTYEQGQPQPFLLGFSELQSVHTAEVRTNAGGAPTATASNDSGPDTTGTGSNFGTISLAPGFRPDPARATGTSGGSLDASTVGNGCVGWISRQPDHLFVANGDFSPLRVMVKSEQDTTLVIYGPDGRYRCVDDVEGRHPMIAGDFAAGTYRIWVGSYTQGQMASYTLGLSELSSVQPSSL